MLSFPNASVGNPECENKYPVIARIPNDEVDRETKQSAKIGLPQISLSVQIAPQSGMLKTHFTRKRSQ
jgi:hypothetical protein